MTPPSMPFVLRVWLLLTRCLALPARAFARYSHGRMGGAQTRFAERLGEPGEQHAGPVIWCHAASLGEVAQIRALVPHLLQAHGQKILVTTTTASGADWVARELPEVMHRFAPIDTPAAVRRFLEAWQISSAIFVEGDLWPRLVLETGARGIPRILLNARHSRSRQRFASLFSALLRDFSLVTCRSAEIAEGLRALGVDPKALHVLPDLRIDLPQLPCPPDALEGLRASIGARPIWLAASTHAADEAAVLDAHGEVLGPCPNALLILAPRHPKRAASLMASAEERGLGIAQRSAGDTLTDDTQVYLADTLGELGIFFALSPIAFMGGALGEEGGHNPYEPASFGTAILSGPKVRNFSDAFAQLETVHAALLLDGPDLGAQVIALLQSDQGAAMGAAGQAFMTASQKGVETTAKLISDVLAESGAVSSAIAKRAEGPGEVP